MSGSAAGSEVQARRQDAMRVLANASADELRQIYADMGMSVEASVLRGPETGLVTLRGRMGGGGAAFNVGEATVTRVTVRLATGEVGHAYHLGRDAERVRIAATIDALIQQDGNAQRIERELLGPLRQRNASRSKRKRDETAATRVDFFTMVRGEH
ncbi:phosphonate C-P lyase system protein PhnG [Aquamicrobium zhengzhouense]|uniref:Phosphonate C-P lyase system protein PhnG n=1 Tax=Aquamicrobium zhengzhouense TaxID=2781738 RepID=A0ABS0SG20_9HYPH|nr:phosphonate C-P lyase system protein PhnG [Aquamicrobium zhengzhouense]MBI1621383.1 phosphonate C-P lyase system protein PhnG [Aquamicrobium zhengzhouense]